MLRSLKPEQRIDKNHRRDQQENYGRSSYTRLTLHFRNFNIYFQNLNNELYAAYTLIYSTMEKINLWSVIN